MHKALSGELTLTEIADFFGISVPSVSAWGLQARKVGKAYKVSVATLLRHFREKAARGGTEALKDRDRKQCAEADLAEMERDRMAGTLMDAAEVRIGYTHEVANMRSRLLALPAKVALRIEPGMTQAEREAVAMAEVREALEELSGAFLG